MGLTGVLNIAKTALLTNQAGIQATSHNIANVNTEGYSRQRLNLATGVPLLDGGKFFGTGVFVNGVERVYDRFLGIQISDARELMGKYDGLKNALGRLESIFNDSQDLGLGDVLSEFFNALDDVAVDSSSFSARTVLIGKANTLADRINGLDSRLKGEIKNIEAQIKGNVSDINGFAARVADMNSRIQLAEAGGGQQANDLRDERDLLVQNIAEKIDITVIENSDGQVDILTAGGGYLVSSNRTSTLSVSADSENNNYYKVFMGSRDITSDISSGELKGLLDARDINYQETLTKLENLTASISREINVIHTQGYGLDGSTGLDFFNPLTVNIRASSFNTGGATANASVLDMSALTLDDYEIIFTSSTSYNIVNKTEGTTISTGNTYTSGANIDIDGIRLVVADDTGTPRSGDVYTLSTTKDAALNFGVSLSDANQFAAAKAPADLPGDNSNVMDMIAVRDSRIMSDGDATFIDFYSGMVAEIGASTSEASLNSTAQASILSSLNIQRESVSGVSLDEEGANLIKYQSAYQAAAKVITVVDEMFDDLINLR